MEPSPPARREATAAAYEISIGTKRAKDGR